MSYLYMYILVTKIQNIQEIIEQHRRTHVLASRNLKGNRLFGSFLKEINILLPDDKPITFSIY